MAYNPYEQTGFSSSFTDAFRAGIESRRQKMQEAQAAQEMQLAQNRDTREQAMLGLEGQKVGFLGRDTATREKEADTQAFTAQTGRITANSEVGLNAQRIAESQSAVSKNTQEMDFARQMLPLQKKLQQSEITARNSQSAEAVAAANNQAQDAKIKIAELKRQDDIAHLTQAKAYLQSAVPDDPIHFNQWVNSAKGADAALNHGMVNPNGQTHDDLLNWANYSYRQHLDQFNGREVNGQWLDLAHQKNPNIQAGAKVIGQTITDFHVDPNKKIAVFDTNVTVKNKDGSLQTYTQPMLNDQGHPQVMPFSDIETRARADSSIAHGIQGWGIQNGVPANKQALLSAVDSHIEAVTAQDPMKFDRPYRYGFANMATGGLTSWSPPGGGGRSSQDQARLNYLNQYAIMMRTPGADMVQGPAMAQQYKQMYGADINNDPWLTQSSGAGLGAPQAGPVPNPTGGLGNPTAIQGSGTSAPAENPYAKFVQQGGQQQ